MNYKDRQMKLNFYRFQFEVFSRLHTFICTEHNPCLSSCFPPFSSKRRKLLADYIFPNSSSPYSCSPHFLLTSQSFLENSQVKRYLWLQVFEDILPAIFFFVLFFSSLCQNREPIDTTEWRIFCCHPWIFLNRKTLTYGLFADNLL